MNKNYLLRRIENIEADIEGSVVFPNQSTLLKFDENTEGELLWDGEQVIGGVGTITIQDVDGLQIELDAKSDINHTHTISDVTGLQTALNGKSDIEHTHGISDVTGLESSLAGKASVEDLHEHANKSVLDSLSDDSGSLQYNGAPIGETSFIALTDTPSAWGTVGQVPVVNSTGDGLEFQDVSGGGASDFDNLSDTPSSKTGNAGKVVAVNATEDALEYIDAPSGGGGGGSATPWTSFQLTVRTNRIPTGDITDNQAYWRETSDGDIEMYGIFNWLSSASSYVIFVNLPFFADVDFKGMGYLPVSISGGENRPPAPVDGGWYGGLRDNGFFELKNSNAAY